MKVVILDYIFYLCLPDILPEMKSEMIPGLSKWQLEEAHRHAVQEGPGQQVTPTA